MQNNTSKIIIALLVILILLVGAGIVVLNHKKDSTENTDYNFPTQQEIQNSTNNTEQSVVSGNSASNEIRFSGTVDSYSTGCYADGECSVTVSGKKVITTIGWSQQIVGSVRGINGLDELENKKGAAAEVYARKVDGGYTLYGNKDYYIEIKNSGSSNLNTYSNAQNGFSFKYPSSWKIVDSGTNKQVKITTNDTPADGNGAPTFSITFTQTDKTFFNQPNRPIQTKYGEITYDQNGNSIFIDGQCRKAEGIEGSSVQGVRYGGSLMSDPAYGDSAIVTTNKNIIIVHTEMGVALSDATRAQIKAIFDSFNLLNGNKVFIPVCN